MMLHKDWLAGFVAMLHLSRSGNETGFLTVSALSTRLSIVTVLATIKAEIKTVEAMIHDQSTATLI